MRAAAVLRGRLARVAPGGMRMLVVTDYTAGSSPWIDGLIRRRLTGGMSRCGHLQRQPGPGYVHAGEGFGRCLRCHLEAAAAEPERRAEAACGRCGVADGGGRKAVAVEAGRWVMFSCLCSVCELVLLHERDQAATASTSAGR